MFSDVNHVGIVTHDLEKAVRTWTENYGVAGWRTYVYDSSNMSAEMDGRPVDFRMRVALCRLGPHFRLEIIQPLDELSPYAESLRRHAGADHIHHIRFDAADPQGAVSQLHGLGLKTKLRAEFKGKSGDARVEATYFTTEADLGFTVEIVDMPDGFTMPDAEPDPSDRNGPQI